MLEKTAFLKHFPDKHSKRNNHPESQRDYCVDIFGPGLNSLMLIKRPQPSHASHEQNGFINCRQIGWFDSI